MSSTVPEILIKHPEEPLLSEEEKRYVIFPIKKEASLFVYSYCHKEKSIAIKSNWLRKIGTAISYIKAFLSRTECTQIFSPVFVRFSVYKVWISLRPLVACKVDLIIPSAY